MAKIDIIVQHRSLLKHGTLVVNKTDGHVGMVYDVSNTGLYHVVDFNSGHSYTTTIKGIDVFRDKIVLTN